MSKPIWYDPAIDASPFRAALHKTRRLACHEGANWHEAQAIKNAIDDYAEAATGNRQYFWLKPVSVG
jgi:hypothetical protein